MTNFTKNEKAVYNLIAEISFSGSVADINDVVAHTDLDAKQARGVISSLVKKDLVTIDEFEGVQYWPSLRFATEYCEEGQGGFFWCDELSDDEYEAQLIKDDEDAEPVAEEAAEEVEAPIAFNKEDFSYHGGYLMYKGDAGRFNEYYEQPCHPTREGLRRELFVARFKYSAKDKGRFLTFLIKNFTAQEYFAATSTQNPENAFRNTFAPATVLEAKGYISATTRGQMKKQGYTVFNKETYRDYMNTCVFTSNEGHEEYWARVDREHAAILEACAAA